MTRGEKNEARRQAYKTRYDKILPSGYIIKEHCSGDKRYMDSYTYYIHKDGVCIHPGGCYNTHEYALGIIEKLIENGKSRTN